MRRDLGDDVIDMQMPSEQRFLQFGYHFCNKQWSLLFLLRQQQRFRFVVLIYFACLVQFFKKKRFLLF